MTRSRKRKLSRVRAKKWANKWDRWAGVPLASAMLAGNAMAAATSDADVGSLQEIVVTAEKRSEDQQKVPISLQVLTGEALEQHQVTDIADYAKLLPSVSYQSLGPGRALLYFRGISSGNDGLFAGSLPTTGVYLDEIPVTTIGNSLDIHTYDIARVEALAGPQGTLYGASSLSGTLRIITNKPDPKAFAAGYDFKADKFGRGNGGGTAEGFVNIPLTDDIAVRLVGYYDHVGGYINNVLVHNTIDYGIPSNPASETPVAYDNAAAARQRANDVGTYGGRAALKIDLNDNWTITPQLLTQTQRTNGNFEYNPQLGDLNIGDYTLGVNEDRWYQSGLTVQGKVSNFDIVYSGGWFQREVDNVVDYSAYTIGYDAAAQHPGATSNYNSVFISPTTGKPLYPFQYNSNIDHYTKQNHEFRVSSPADFPFRATAGLFYERQTDNISAAFGGNSLPIQYAVPGFPNAYYLSREDRADRDYAAFTEFTYDLTSQWKLTAGIRKFWVENTLYGFFGFAGAIGSCSPAYNPASTVANFVPCINTNKKVIENGETHKISLSYQITPDQMVYTTYSTGFRPGGNNRRVGVAPYGADTLVNIEGGWKTSWLQNRIRWNGALFFERWDGVQYSIQGANGITSIVNAGNADVKGVESEVSWLAFEGLTLSASGTYVNARITQNFCDADPVTEAVTHNCADPNAPAGSALPVTPKLKTNGTARYEFKFHDYQTFFQGSILHQGSSASDLRTLQNSELGDLPHFTTFDFSVGFGLKNWKVEAYVENAFDNRGELNRKAICNAPYCYQNYLVYPVTPQNFGLKFGQKF